MVKDEIEEKHGANKFSDGGKCILGKINISSIRLVVSANPEIKTAKW